MAFHNSNQAYTMYNLCGRIIEIYITDNKCYGEGSVSLLEIQLALRLLAILNACLCPFKKFIRIIIYLCYFGSPMNLL